MQLLRRLLIAIGLSATIEIVVWAIPVLMIIALGIITYVTSFSVDPRKPIDSKNKPVVIQVVAMDWKWLFIYPEQQIATVNELAIPVNSPVEFLVTSDTVMNSFFIPNLGSQIYAMSGMENRLYLMADEPGEYRGFSANYSSFGFSGMKFTALARPFSRISRVMYYKSFSDKYRSNGKNHG